jgi:hypothetical protein
MNRLRNHLQHPNTPAAVLFLGTHYGVGKILGWAKTPVVDADDPAEAPKSWIWKRELLVVLDYLLMMTS